MDRLLVILTGSLALVLTYRCVRYWLWFEQETVAGAQYYAKLRSWSVRTSDLDDTRRVLVELRRGVTVATVVAWAAFVAALV